MKQNYDKEYERTKAGVFKSLPSEYRAEDKNVAPAGLIVVK
jgi:hypothetical protein